MEDVIGKTDYDMYPEKLATQYWEDDKTILESGISVIDREEPGLDADGNDVWLLTTKVPIRDGNGEVSGLIGIGRKYSRVSKKTEMALTREKQFMETLVQSNPVAVVMLDIQEKITHWNPAFEKLFGYTADEISGWSECLDP